MPPPTPSVVYVTEADLDSVLSVAGHDGRVDDDPAATARACYWATGRVNLYALGRYDALDLANSWVVNEWAVNLACHQLSRRRGNPPPGSFDTAYQETLEDLKAIKTGALDLTDCGLRSAAWPAWSNMRVDTLYRLRKIRVEKPISEKTPQRGPFLQNVDIGAQFLVEPNGPF